MATKTLTRWVDDIDGAEADETICFTFDNTQYEIDLSKQNSANFRKAVGEYISTPAKWVDGHASPQQRKSTLRRSGPGHRRTTST